MALRTGRRMGSGHPRHGLQKSRNQLPWRRALFLVLLQRGNRGRRSAVHSVRRYRQKFFRPAIVGKIRRPDSREEMDSNPNSSARIPMREFTIGSIHQFEANRTAKIIFGQATADAKEHTLIIDEIKIDDNAAAAATHAQTLPAPQSISTKGYERHIDIAWNAVSAPDLRRYVIYRSMDGRDFEPIGIQVPGVNRYTDYVGNPGPTAHYKVATSGRQYQMSTFSAEASATTRTMSDDELLTMLQEACFRYYWEGAHPVA